MQNVLKSLKSECANDVKVCEQLNKTQFSQMPLIWLILIMLATTLIYMAWSIYKIHNMHHSINSIHQEKSEADRKADLFFESVQKKKAKR